MGYVTQTQALIECIPREALMEGNPPRGTLFVEFYIVGCFQFKFLFALRLNENPLVVFNLFDYVKPTSLYFELFHLQTVPKNANFFVFYVNFQNIYHIMCLINLYFIFRFIVQIQPFWWYFNNSYSFKLLYVYLCRPK